jgi:hypothetical protein
MFPKSIENLPGKPHNSLKQDDNRKRLWLLIYDTKPASIDRLRQYPNLSLSIRGHGRLVLHFVLQIMGPKTENA